MTHKTKFLSGVRPISSQRDHPDKPLTVEPITITVAETCRITGYGSTTVWGLIKKGKIRVLRLEDVRRTLPYLASVKELLAPQLPPTEGTSAGPQPKCGRGQPHKLPRPEANG
jgi:hypothetical protein